MYQVTQCKNHNGFLQVYSAIVAFLHLSCVFIFQSSFLSRINPKFLALSLKERTESFILGGMRDGILYFLEKSTSSVLTGFTPRQHLSAQVTSFCSLTDIRPHSVWGNFPVKISATSSACEQLVD